jgi:hypothetical protein
VQRKYLEQVPVTYPLLTVNAGVSNLYRDIVRYPALFLSDRKGDCSLHRVRTRPFEKVEAAVDALLNTSSSTRGQGGLSE